MAKQFYAVIFVFLHWKYLFLEPIQKWGYLLHVNILRSFFVSYL
jgi:hypothetical protein